MNDVGDAAGVPGRTRILLLRHGQSEWNALGLWQGQEDPPLSDLGSAQARQAACSLGSVDGVFASPLQRAAVTAQVIGEHLGVGPVVELPGLMERHAGEWQGRTRDEIEELWPGYLDSGRRPPGWENDTLVEERAEASLLAIAGRFPGGNLLAVAHAGIIYAIERLLGSPFERIGNLAGREVFHDAAGMRLGDRVHLIEHETIPGQL